MELSQDQQFQAELAAEKARRAQYMSLLDMGLCAAVFLALVLNSTLGSLSPLIVLGSLPLFFVIHRWRIPRVLAASWPLLLLPAFALASYFWSDAPAATLRYGLIYLITILAGVIIGAGIRPEDVLKALFFSLFFYGVATLLDGRFVSMGNGAELAFVGLQDSKNQAGMLAALLVLVSTATAGYAYSQSRLWFFWTACLGVVMGFATLYLAKATGALIACSVAWICLIAWGISRRLSIQARGAIFLIAIFSVAAMLLTLDYWLPPLFEFVLETAGKDRGLTGRDFIWRLADDLIERRPVLGLGYSAFWLDGNLESNRILREMGVNDPRGFNFHSTYREITVHLGFVGLALFTLVFSASAFVLLVRTMIVPTFPMILSCALLIYFSMSFPLESFGFGGMNLGTMMMFAILAMGYSSLLWRDDKGDRTFA